jgi:hypothetical protein
VVLVHLPLATAGAEALLARSAGIILVSESAGDVVSILGSASSRVLAVIGPEAVGELEPEPTDVVEAEPEPEPEVEMVSDMDNEEQPELEEEPTVEPESEAPSELEAELELEVESPVESDLAPAGVPEEDPSEGGLFSTEELPESTGNAAEPTDDSDAFSFAGMAGSQYDTSGEAEAEVTDEPEPVVPQPDEPATSVAAPLEGEDEEEATLSMEAESVEMEPPEVESTEADVPESDEPEAVAPEVEAPSTKDEEIVEEDGMIEGVTRSAVEMDEAAVAAAAEDAHLDMVGFETGSGFDLEDAPDDADVDLGDDEAALGGESEEETDDSEDFAFGDGGLEVEASPVAEDVAPEDEREAEDLSGVAGDVAFGDVASLSADADVSGDASPADTAGGSIAVDPAEEAMGADADTTPSDEAAQDVDVDQGPPAKMSGLAELERRRKRGARVRQLLVGLVTALIVGGGGVGVAYFGFVNIPGITPVDRVRSAVLPPVELPGPTPVTPVITHVLAVDAWRNLETALSTVDALRERLPEFLFFVTVTEVAGGDQYGLLAGPAFSAVEADALKEPLAEVLDRLDPVTWTVQEARYSFFFGEYAGAAGATGRLQSLAALSIPAHILEVSYPDETTAMRVYGGAFVDEFQAAAMGRLLRSNDLGDVRLIERRGRLPE